MHIHALQHVSFAGPAHIASWAEKHAHTLTTTHLYQGETLPSHSQYDRLVIMGGPMNIYEHTASPWLAEEKRFIQAALKQNKTIVGICLGAQLLADALGSAVYPAKEKEIGWFPVTLHNTKKAPALFSKLPKRPTVLHWHGDTFDLPENCQLLASSAACQNQAFLYGDRVFGLQFHLEVTSSSLSGLLENCADELVAGQYIQSQDQIKNNLPQHVAQLHVFLESILDQLP